MVCQQCMGGVGPTVGGWVVVCGGGGTYCVLMARGRLSDVFGASVSTSAVSSMNLLLVIAADRVYKNRATGAATQRLQKET